MENNNPIYQWLSTVQDHEQRGHQDEGIALAESQEQANDTTLTTSIPRVRIPLEISENVRGNGHSASRKRNSCQLDETKASSAHGNIPGSESHKRSRNCYELGPRHKTREDRYEYKGPSSAMETHRKRRAKKLQGRRHTLNDDFHAINVTGNRLTLRSNTNLGIFSKGRSSTTNHHGHSPSTALAKPTPSVKPHKHAVESDLSFSEMNFLSRRNNLSPYPPSTARDTFDGQHEREYHPQKQQFNDPAHDSRLSHSNSKLLDVERQLDSSVTPLFIFEKAPVSEISPVSSHSRGGSPECPHKRRKTAKQSSSIPYTWTETEVDTTEHSHALEQHLLNLLRVGLYPQALCSEITNTVLTRRYWSLAELRALLEERKASWSSEADIRHRAVAEAAPQEVPEIIAPDSLDVVNVGSVQNQTSKQSPDSNVACETTCRVNNGLPQQPSVLERQQDGPCQASDKPRGLNSQADSTSSQGRFIDILNEDQCEPLSQELIEDEIIFPTSVPEVEQPHMSGIEFYELDRVDDDDDDLFYRTLDAAYHAIVHPGVAAEVALNLQQLLESPELNGADLPNTPELTGVRDSDIPSRRVKVGEPECLATVSQAIIQERFDERPPAPSCQQKLSTGHSDDPWVGQNNDLPWLTTGYGQLQPRGSTEFDARQSQPPGLSDFWRQNKLY
ncbi:hypothetical protein N7447_008672 [Penicillium robsamsonii]|uniref:uncharacterized protein n=1 Tax=Penicillium robsamsonii TaxID=1792511 RepID=UPI0025481872|nr:uncharacterized protein N7447_008672 [Penicillium robsamsonii]KAJ5816439.1 hypothetical protein N7447_008672 [Penicillium robsamsonii]